MSIATLTTPTCRSVQQCERVSSVERRHPEPLAARLVAGDERVIGELYRTYGGRIMGLALRVLNDRQLAEEVVQETIVRVWRRAATFDETRELEPWLFRIARNTAYDMGRARGRRPRSQWGDPTPALEGLAAGDHVSDPALASENLETRWAVRTAIDELPETLRDVVRLQHLGGLSHTEIATRLGISLGTVKSRSHRAHGKLAAALRSAE